MNGGFVREILIAMLILVVDLGFASLCAYLAYRKGRNAYLWFLLGLLFWPIVIWIVLFLPRVEPRRCPFCGDLIGESEEICSRCRADL